MANTISDQLNRLIQAKAGIKSALQEKHLTISDSSTLDEYPGLIQEMEVGGGDGSDTSVLFGMIQGNIGRKYIVPNGVTTIRSYCFQGFGNTLKTLIFPTSVTTLNDNICEQNNRLESATFLSLTPPTAATYTFQNAKYMIYVPGQSLNTYKTASQWSKKESYINPIASMSYDSQTYTVTALGRDNLELYVDASLCDSSVYTFPSAQHVSDKNYNVEVRSVDPSLGLLDSSTMTVTVPGTNIAINQSLALITDAETDPELYQSNNELPDLLVGQTYNCSYTGTAIQPSYSYNLRGRIVITTDLSDKGKTLDSSDGTTTLTGNHYYVSDYINVMTNMANKAKFSGTFSFTATNADKLYMYVILDQQAAEREKHITDFSIDLTPVQ